jgi:hypothetical protein
VKSLGHLKVDILRGRLMANTLIVVHALAGDPLNDRDTFRLWRGPGPDSEDYLHLHLQSKAAPAVAIFIQFLVDRDLQFPGAGN